LISDSTFSAALACDYAYDSAHATGHPENAEDLYGKVEKLAVHRAREIYTPGPEQ
jgi:hypothetical protein